MSQWITFSLILHDLLKGYVFTQFAHKYSITGITEVTGLTMLGFVMGVTSRMYHISKNSDQKPMRSYIQ